jgi:hypothetical protein
MTSILGNRQVWDTVREIDMGLVVTETSLRSGARNRIVVPSSKLRDSQGGRGLGTFFCRLLASKVCNKLLPGWLSNDESLSLDHTFRSRY